MNSPVDSMNSGNEVHAAALRYPPFLGEEARVRQSTDCVAAVLPVPYDETSTFHKGADRGPNALLEASAAVELYDIETGTEMYLKGVHTEEPVIYSGDPEGLAERVEQRIESILDQTQLPIVVGGEHSVSIGAIRGCAARFENMSVLQIDAHGDTREIYHGSKFNHACVMARAMEWCPCVQVGIRSIDVEELPSLQRNSVFYAHEIVGNRDTSWMDTAVERLTDDVYVTIDLDAFDPSVLPATGTPEPGGLGWYEVTECLRRVIERRRVVAFDVVELLPMPGHHASDFLAAKLIYRILSMRFADSERS